MIEAFNLNIGPTGASFIIVLASFIQLFAAIYTAANNRAASRERNQLNKEIFGLMKRIEALTSSSRKQVLSHYDKILSELTIKVPAAVAMQAGQNIFDTESKILCRLAELDPASQADDLTRRKMDDLIKSMENLEQTVVAIAAEAVRKALLEGRSHLLDEERLTDSSLAA